MKNYLKRGAKPYRNIEDEARHLLRHVGKERQRTVHRLGSRIAARFQSVGLIEDLQELRGHAVRPRPSSRRQPRLAP